MAVLANYLSFNFVAPFEVIQYLNFSSTASACYSDMFVEVNQDSLGGFLVRIRREDLVSQFDVCCCHAGFLLP